MRSSTDVGITADEVYCCDCKRFVRRRQVHSRRRLNVNSNKQQQFKAYAYGLDCLTEFVAEYSSRTEGTNYAQRRAKARYRKWNLKSNPSTDITLMDYFELFDDWIFAGSLRARAVNVLFTQRLVEGNLGVMIPTPGDHDIEARFEITVSRSAHDTGTAILGTLLHEMAHAFISMYHCHCETCCLGSITTMGSGGHGTAWVKLAHHLEQFAKRELEDTRIGIETAEQEEEKSLYEAAYLWEQLNSLITSSDNGFNVAVELNEASQRPKMLLERDGNILHLYIEREPEN